MTPKPSVEQVDAADDEHKIVNYLRIHGDFFVRHPDLLLEMTLPHDAGSGVSLIERQVLELRAQNDTLKKKLSALVANARHNERLHQQMHEVLLAVVRQPDIRSVLESLAGTIKQQFALSLAVPRIANVDWQSHECEYMVDADDANYRKLRARIAHGRSVCDDRLPSEILTWLFGDEAATVGSCVLVPLGGSEPVGFLALAAHDESRFRSDLDTMFLDRLGAVVGALMQRLLIDNP